MMVSAMRADDDDDERAIKVIFRDLSLEVSFAVNCEFLAGIFERSFDGFG